ncbi:MAG: hypothetical protein ABJE95_08425 [Byssovorax sp.]
MAEEAKLGDLQVRGVGVILIAAGALLLKVGLFDVLRDAEAHSGLVKTSMTALMFAPAAILLGLVAVTLGARARGPDSAIARSLNGVDRQPSQVRKVVTTIVLMLPGLLLYAWLRSRLSALGFE